MPHKNSNCTLEDDYKATNRSYGKVNFSKIGSSGVGVWFRIKYDGSYHYYTASGYYVQCKKTNKDYHVKYVDKSSNYYKSGVYSELRAENLDNTWLVKDKVSGKVWIN